MIIVGILGDIGSGKSLLAKQFGYPVFNADKEVSNEIFNGATHVISCIPPLASGEDPVLLNLKTQLLNSKHLKWVGYLSTTGVYGDAKGGWVNENTSPNPQQ